MTFERNERFTNSSFSNLQEVNRSPIFGYEDSPILTLEEAVEKIQPPIDRLMDYVKVAKRKYNRHSTFLTQDESAAIYLYTMQTPLFSNLNKVLRIENRDALKPWFAFLKLLISGLEKLPSIKQTVWRGVQKDIVSVFDYDNVHTWWSITSCSLALNVVRPYLYEDGTLFAIDVINGKDISEFSTFPDEKEVVIIPGTRLHRKSEPISFMNYLHIVHLEEINTSE